ncbi:MAG: dephospho-CoA kinase [Spirochaetaceae bacterium]|nr:dephospho-CoA kinase [Spirochaetaceae bacterium]
MNKNQRKMLIGLSGPMAAGKNLAGEILEKMGCAVIDADETAHIALENTKQQVLAAFLPEAERLGINLLNEDRTVNRKALAGIVFASQEALQKQESIIHPEVSRLLEEFIAAHPEQTCVLNATVLNKVPLAAKCDFIIYVDAPFIVRLIRAKKRDHHSVFHLLKRFSSQKKLYAQYQKLNVDIYRVRNIGSSSKLHKKLQRIFESRCFK